MSEISGFGSFNPLLNPPETPDVAPGTFGRQLLQIAQTPPGNGNLPVWAKERALVETLQNTPYVDGNSLTRKGVDKVWEKHEQFKREYPGFDLPMQFAAKGVYVDHSANYTGERDIDAALRDSKIHQEYTQELQRLITLKGLLEQIGNTTLTGFIDQNAELKLQWGEQVLSLKEFVFVMRETQGVYPTTLLIQLAEEQLNQMQIDVSGDTNAAQIETFKQANENRIPEWEARLKWTGLSLDNVLTSTRPLNPVTVNTVIETQRQEVITAFKQADRTKTAQWRQALRPTGITIDAAIDQADALTQESVQQVVDRIVDDYEQRQAVLKQQASEFLREQVPADTHGYWMRALKALDTNPVDYLVQRIDKKQSLDVDAINAEIDQLPAIKSQLIGLSSTSKNVEIIEGEQYKIVNMFPDIVLRKLRNEAVGADSGDLHFRFIDQNGDTVTGFSLQGSGSLIVDMSDKNIMLSPEVMWREGDGHSQFGGMLPSHVIVKGASVELSELIGRKTKSGGNYIKHILLSKGDEFYKLPTNAQIKQLQQIVDSAVSPEAAQQAWEHKITPAELRSTAGIVYQEMLRSAVAGYIAHIDMQYNQVASIEDAAEMKRRLKDYYSGIQLGRYTDKVLDRVRDGYGQRIAELLVSGVKVDDILVEIDLSHANLIQSNLVDMRFDHPNLSFANLEDADLHGLKLISETWQGINMIGANLRKANLAGVTLHGVDLTGAKLQFADLTNADLSVVFLNGADLSGADVSGARFDEVWLNRANWDVLQYDDNTVWNNVRLTLKQFQALGLESPGLNTEAYAIGHPDITMLVKISGKGKQIDDLTLEPHRKHPVNREALQGGIPLNLYHYDFSGGDFSGMTIDSSSDFGFSNFNNADLRRTNLEYAHIMFSSFYQVFLQQAQLNFANAPYADFQQADLSSASMKDFYGVGAGFRSAVLVDAILTYADLQGTDFTDANLQGANLRYADLRSANLQNANIKGADLRNADLRNANLEGLEFDGQTLWNGARLTSAQIAMLNLSEEQLLKNDDMESFAAADNGQANIASETSEQQTTDSLTPSASKQAESSTDNSIAEQLGVNNDESTISTQLPGGSDNQSGYTRLNINGLQQDDNQRGGFSARPTVTLPQNLVDSFQQNNQPQTDNGYTNLSAAIRSVLTAERYMQLDLSADEIQTRFTRFQNLHPNVRADIQFNDFVGWDDQIISQLERNSAHETRHDADIRYRQQQAITAQQLADSQNRLAQAQQKHTAAIEAARAAKSQRPGFVAEPIQSTQSTRAPAQWIGDQTQIITNNAQNNIVNANLHNTDHSIPQHRIEPLVPMVALSGKTGSLVKQYQDKTSSIPRYLYINTAGQLQLHAVVAKGKQLEAIPIPAHIHKAPINASTTAYTNQGWIGVPQLSELQKTAVDAHIRIQQTNIVPMMPAPAIPAAPPAPIGVPLNGVPVP